MNKITKLSTVALALMLCVGCSANKDNQKTKTEQPKQEKSIAKQKQEREAEKAMIAKGAIDLTKYKAKPIEDYGQKIDVGDGKKMNIYTMGQGKIPLVVFPGQAEISKVGMLPCQILKMLSHKQLIPTNQIKKSIVDKIIMKA